jgi:hypothetical protein
MLEIARRTTVDPRTLGTLFYAACDGIRQTSFCEALALLLNLLVQSLEKVGFSKEQVWQKVAEFVELLPPVFKSRLLIMAPECG